MSLGWHTVCLACTKPWVRSPGLHKAVLGTWMFVQFKLAQEHLAETWINETHNSQMTMNLHDGGFPSGLSPQCTVLESHKLCFLLQSLSRLCPVCLSQWSFLFQVSPQRLCKLPKHYHSRPHKFFIPDRSSLPPQPFQAGSSPNQGFLSSVRNSGKTTGIIRKHSSLI